MIIPIIIIKVFILSCGIFKRWTASQRRTTARSSSPSPSTSSHSWWGTHHSLPTRWYTGLYSVLSFVFVFVFEFVSVFIFVFVFVLPQTSYLTSYFCGNDYVEHATGWLAGKGKTVKTHFCPDLHTLQYQLAPNHDFSPVCICIRYNINLCAAMQTSAGFSAQIMQNMGFSFSGNIFQDLLPFSEKPPNTCFPPTAFARLYFDLYSFFLCSRIFPKVLAPKELCTLIHAEKVSSSFPDISCRHSWRNKFFQPPQFPALDRVKRPT